MDTDKWARLNGGSLREYCESYRFAKMTRDSDNTARAVTIKTYTVHKNTAVGAGSLEEPKRFRTGAVVHIVCVHTRAHDHYAKRNYGALGACARRF